MKYKYYIESITGGFLVELEDSSKYFFKELPSALAHILRQFTYSFNQDKYPKMQLEIIWRT